MEESSEANKNAKKKQKIEKLTLKVKLFTNKNRRLKRKLEKVTDSHSDNLNNTNESNTNSVTDSSYQTFLSSISPCVNVTDPS